MSRRYLQFFTAFKRAAKKSRFGIGYLGVLFVLALTCNSLANEWPLLAAKNGQLFLPAFHQSLSDMGLIKSVNYPRLEFFQAPDFHLLIKAPIPYSPSTMDERNSRSVSPFAKQDVSSLCERHWLGTDELGHDVLALLIHGARLALLVGLGSMSIAGFLGILLGALAGYFGDERMRLSRARLLMICLAFGVGFFFAFNSRYFILLDAWRDSMLSFLLQACISIGLFLIIFYVFYRGANWLEKVSFFNTRFALPLDALILRLIEVLLALPMLFLILAIVAIAKPSLGLVVVIIGFTSWTGIARLVRAEMLRIRSMPYMEASQALGFSPGYSLWRHALPNAMGPVFVALAFGFANAILIESGLSFLGLGVPPEVLTWGALLAEARQSASSWWLAIVPGLAIFCTVMACNSLAERFAKRPDSSSAN